MPRVVQDKTAFRKFSARNFEFFASLFHLLVETGLELALFAEKIKTFRVTFI